VAVVLTLVHTIVENVEGKVTIVTPWRTWGDNIKNDIKEII
jgi:hypothetical protein